jgi:hypothetical protein
MRVKLRSGMFARFQRLAWRLSGNLSILVTCITSPKSFSTIKCTGNEIEPDLTELVTTFFTGYSNLICYIAALNREDRKDREENIIMGFVAVIHARSYAGLHRQFCFRRVCIHQPGDRLDIHNRRLSLCIWIGIGYSARTSSPRRLSSYLRHC